jgi:DNA-binding transcriptional MerR regulator
MTPLPPKLYFRIGEVANLVGVEPHVLRYWEREFRSIRPTKSAKGQRVYSRRDVENLMRVRDLLYADGFTIAGAKKKLQRNGTEPDAEEEADAEESARSAIVRPASAPESAPEFLATAATSTARLAVEGDRGGSPRLADREEAPAAAKATSDPDAPRVYVRAALKELRSEIEALLAELGG